jgi:hypothetical protein
MMRHDVAAGVGALSHAALAPMLPARATGLRLCCTGKAAQPDRSIIP